MASRDSTTPLRTERNLAAGARAHRRGVNTNAAEVVLFQIGTVVAVALAAALVANLLVLTH
jgi:hypothetical protein